MKKMLKNIKIFATLLILFLLVPQTTAANKGSRAKNDSQIESNIKVDCAFSVGGWCICARHLQDNNLRQTASPIDWMRAHSLNGVAHLFETKFSDFFENVKVTCKKRKNGMRTVRDLTNDVESIHYMPSDVPFDQALKKFKKKMGKRAKKVDKIISSSRSILLLNCREYLGKFGKNSTDEELKNFAARFAKAYPNLKKIYLIDIHNDKNEKIRKRVIEKSDKIEIIQYKFKNIDGKKFKTPFGNNKAWNKILKNVKLTSKKPKN